MNMYLLCRNFLFEFQLLCEYRCWWTSKAQAAKIRRPAASVYSEHFDNIQFSISKLINCNYVVFCTISLVFFRFLDFSNKDTYMSFPSSNIPPSSAYGVFISTNSVCSSYECLIWEWCDFSISLLMEGCIVERLNLSLRMSPFLNVT